MTPSSREFRCATAEDADALLALERAASTVALAYVFPAAQYPYPDDEVLHRWQRVLGDGRTTVLLADDQHGPVCLIAFDDELIHHLAVRPDSWRAGWARRAVAEAVDRAAPYRLWCLRDNARALAAYGRLGWRPSGREQQAEFAPYPVEVELTRTTRTTDPGAPDPTG